jgi:hypothetical protein
VREVVSSGKPILGEVLDEGARRNDGKKRAVLFFVSFAWSEVYCI